LKTAAPRLQAPRSSRVLAVCVAVALVGTLVGTTVVLRASATAELDDAYVIESADGRQWDVGNRAIRYQMGLDSSGVLVARGLARPDRESVIVPGRSDAAFAYDDQVVGVGDRAFRFLAAESNVVAGRLVLTLAFGMRDRDLTVGRHYAIAPGAPVVEMWTSVHGGEETTLRNLEGLRLETTARDAWWHRGHDTSDEEGGPFTRRTARLVEGQTVDLGSAVLSSQEALPWFGLSAGDDHLVVGLAWSGGWRASLEGTAVGARVQVGLRDMSVRVGPDREVEFPHAFVGVTDATAGAESEALAAWLAARRNGRPFPALVTYNTWFPFGTYIDDRLVREQIDGFAAVGGELFQLDAGWYPPVNAQDRYDFSAGLGSWTVDRERFPGGLGAISDYAHERGLRFGVWTEPERVDLATVGRAGAARERYLARQHGQYQPGRGDDEATRAQVCLADEEAWQWVRERLFAFIDEARPDYLKIDFNEWVLCTRTDHDHTIDGGNFGHVRGLYRLLEALRERYPHLLIENCAGGARRLDAEMLTRTDVSWMDDRTTSAARVRHHLEVLTALAPPQALLSYLMGPNDQPLTDARDLPLLAQSRMPGVFGLAIDFRTVGIDASQALATQIEAYKQVRSLRGAPFAARLTEPVGVDGSGPGWDVVQQVNPASGVVTVFAFRNAGGDRSVRVQMPHLQPGTTYRVRTLGGRVLGQASGDDLMQGGLDIELSSPSDAQVLVVEPQ
jgi:alpha-galactosidase